MPATRRKARSAAWARLAPAAAVVLTLAAGCSYMQPSPVFTSREITVEAETSLPVVEREDLLNEISLYHGVPYKSGGESFEGLDCSGLVRAVFSPLGVDLARTTTAQYESGIPISRKEIRTGDLVFFGGREPDHVGIAVSAREMVHASLSQGVVQDNIENFSKSSRFSGARRVVTVK